MEFFVPLFLVIFITLAVLSYFLLQDRKWREQWRDLAENYGMEVKPGSWKSPGTAKGNYRGRRICFRTYSYTETNYYASAYALSAKQTWYTQIALSLENQPSKGITLWKKGLTDRVIKQLGGQTGDEQFDKQFFAHESHKGFLNSTLDSSTLRKNILQAHWPRGTTLSIKGNQLTFEMKDREIKITGVISLFDLLCDVAEAVEKIGYGKSELTDLSLSGQSK